MKKTLALISFLLVGLTGLLVAQETGTTSEPTTAPATATTTSQAATSQATTEKAHAGIDEIHMWCSKCKAAIIKKIKDLTDEERQILMMPACALLPEPVRMKCPKCSGNLVRQKPCPGCKKWYADPYDTDIQPNKPLADICPNCNLDVQEYWQKKAAERAGN